MKERHAFGIWLICIAKKQEMNNYNLEPVECNDIDLTEYLKHDIN